MEDDAFVIRLGFDDDSKEYYHQHKVEINKFHSRFNREVREAAKLTKCYVCGKECTSFCKSHSVPQFCLKRIAPDGKVYFSGMQQDIPFMGEDVGVKEAGTFQLICRECDSRLFQDYENPAVYQTPPSGKVLAQIALKNYLQMISKRFRERVLYSRLSEISSLMSFQHRQEVIELDLAEFVSAYERAKIAASGRHDDWFYLCYYKKLNYVVPFAVQTPVDLISDFDGNIINDVYNMSADYHLKDLHIAVFPLESSSVILLFFDKRNKRYRKFSKQLRRLDEEDQLASINYIIHGYTENVFLSKSIDKKILTNPNFRDVCQISDIVIGSRANTNPLTVVSREHDLSRRNDIPNLLSAQYALDIPD